MAILAVDPFEGRPEGAAQWELPPWGHPLGMGVFPFLINVEDLLIPIGTAFCISRSGLLATAAHNFTAALEYHPQGRRLRRMDQLPNHLDMGDIGFYVLHNWVRESDRVDVNLWPLKGAHGAQPTDVWLASAKLPSTFPFLHLPVSFAVPRVGETVIGFGYSGMEVDSAPGLSLPDLKAGRTEDAFRGYSQKLKAVEGTVKRVYIQNFAPSYLRGPCFEIAASVDPGMSGGPVLNAAGYVCGVISATFGESALISLLYPVALIEVKFGFQVGPMSFSATRPLLDLIIGGTVKSDGSEAMITLLQEEDGEWRVGTLVHKDDADYVSDDRRGHEDGRPASIETRPVLRLHVAPNGGAVDGIEVQAAEKDDD